MQDFQKYLHQFGYRINTIRGTLSGTKNFLEWCKTNKVNANEASYTDLFNYLENIQKITPNKRTISAKIQAVRVYYNYLIKQSIRETNPLTDLRIKNTVRLLPHNIIKHEKLQEIYHSCKGEGVTGKRNRIMVGLMIWQAISTGELTAIEVNDIKIHEGKIYIPQVGRTNSRTLKLEAHQIIELQNYIQKTRPLLLAMSKKQSDKLIVSVGIGHQLNNTCAALLKEVRRTHPEIKNTKQIRASVISHWLKHCPIRQVQYMIGHRYVSSTERYSTKKIESLQDQLEKLMPDI